MGILQLIEDFHEEEQRLNWEGSFAEYLELVEKNPHLAQTAHARIYNMIVDAGVEKEEGRTRYHFFDRELFGLEETIERLVEEYFHSAARRLDVRKRVLLLMGPVSGGKSTIVTLLKRGLEAYTRTDRGAVYAIKDCPMHEDPLHLVPDSLRPQFEREFGIRVEGHLCPVCRLNLREQYGGRV
ncbi:MAG TPA: protein prkA, partial [Alicyclobacillus sp.]|nr:protein prkA [Alicyclobacillus sp.]